MKDQKEIWKYVPQYDGFLQASNLGNIREFIQIIKSDNKPHILVNRPINISRGCFMYKSRTQSAAYIIYCTFVGTPNLGRRIRFKDGNNLNRRPQNLQSENTTQKGEKNYQAKLTNIKIYQLCLDFINGFSGKALAEKYNIHYMNVYRILRNKIWTSVTRPTVTRQIINRDDNKIKKFFEEKVNEK